VRLSALVVAAAWLTVVATRLAAIPFRSEPAAVGEVPHERALYAALVDTVYHPRRYASPTALGGTLLLEVQTATGEPYVDDTSVLAKLRLAALPDSGDSLMVAFRRANSGTHQLSELCMYGPTCLDSATVRRILDAAPADALRETVVSDVLAGLPLDSLPGILALSRPAITPGGNIALAYVSLRTRRSQEPDHLEAAAFFILRRDGFRWRVTAEAPIPRRRLR
jgi:hypothetical protein